MQRLFSTFPNSWPGAGLLLVRLCLGAALIYFGAVGYSSPAADPIGVAQNLLAIVGGVSVVAGLWTPLMGVLLAIEEASRVFLLGPPAREADWMHLFLAVLSISTAMLGPGAWSIDARLFGRTRFEIDRTSGRNP